MTANTNLVEYYEKHLAKVKAAYGDDAFKGADYIRGAEQQLEAVKVGGMDGLKKLWASRSVEA